MIRPHIAKRLDKIAALIFEMTGGLDAVQHSVTYWVCAASMAAARLGLTDEEVDLLTAEDGPLETVVARAIFQERAN